MKLTGKIVGYDAGRRIVIIELKFVPKVLELENEVIITDEQDKD